MINCDKQPYSLDQEEVQYKTKLIQKGESQQVAEMDAKSRREQVESRVYILNWGDKDKLEFRRASEEFKQSNTALKRYFSSLQKHLSPMEFSDWINVPVLHDEIILKWDNHLQHEIRYLSLLDCWADLGAWALVLYHSFQLITKGYITYGIGSDMDSELRSQQLQDMLIRLRQSSRNYNNLSITGHVPRECVEQLLNDPDYADTN